MITERGQKGFLIWMKKNLPRTYQGIAAELKRTSQLNGLALTADPALIATPAPATSSFANTLKDLATVYAQSYLTKKQIDAQNQVLNIQLQRAQQGLAPLDINLEQYGLPRPSVAVGVDSDTQKMLLYGGLALAGLWIFSTLFGGRRRA